MQDTKHLTHQQGGVCAPMSWRVGEEGRFRAMKKGSPLVSTPPQLMPSGERDD
jgi:hypothetical protein